MRCYDAWFRFRRNWCHLKRGYCIKFQVYSNCTASHQQLQDKNSQGHNHLKCQSLWCYWKTHLKQFLGIRTRGFLFIIFLQSVIHLLIFVWVVINNYFSICLSPLLSLSPSGLRPPVMSVMNSCNHRTWTRACNYFICGEL